MSRTLTAAAQAKLGTKLGTEPILLVAIKWNQVTPMYFADKDLVVGSINAEGRLIEASAINIQQKQQGSGAVGTVSITLDDCDGFIKSQLDDTSIERTPIIIYQHYEGGVEADLFKLFEGRIVNPIEWKEGARVLRFDAETAVEDEAIGFAPISTNQYIQVSVADAYKINPLSVGQAWPIVLGTPIKYPVPKPIRASEAVLKESFKKGDTALEVEDGGEFVTGSHVNLELDGVLFRCRYNGANNFSLVQANQPRHQGLSVGARDWGDIDADNPRAFWLANYNNDPLSLVGLYVKIDMAGEYSQAHYVVSQEGAKCILRDPWQSSSGVWDLLGGNAIIAASSLVPLLGWPVALQEELTTVTIADGVITDFDWAYPSGTRVRDWDAPEFLVAGLGVNTVHAVYAERGGQFTQIPDEYYDLLPNAGWQVFDPVTGVTDPTITVSRVRFKRALWQLDGQKWDTSQFYVTATGSVASNTSDQIKHLIDTYSLLSADATSFAAVNTALTKYPSNFAVLEQPPVLTLIEDIAFQARCAILVTDGIIKIAYLSTEPTNILNIDESKVEYKSLTLAYTSTEDIITRLKGSYKVTGVDASYSYTKETNLATYGLREKEVDFFIYNDIRLVRKSVDFWATRLGNAWRLVRLNLFLQALELEVFDAVTLAFSDVTLLRIASIKGIIQAHQYDPDDGVVGLEIWLPSISGSQAVHSDAWVSDAGDTAISSYVYFTQTDPMRVDFSKPRLQKTSPAIVLKKLDSTSDPQELLDAGTHLVDIYDQGFDKPVTRTNVPASLVDDAAPISDNDKVTVYGVETDNKASIPQQMYIQAASSGAIIAKITGGSGPNDYTWELYLGGGPDSGTAAELNGSTGILPNTVVPLFAIDGSYYFFFPVEACS